MNILWRDPGIVQARANGISAKAFRALILSACNRRMADTSNKDFFH